MSLRFWRGRDITVAGEVETRSPDGLEKSRPSSAVRAAIEVKQAAAQLVKFASIVQSIGLASWSLGIAFAGAAVGLRFLNGKDMAAPEFMACFVFAGVLVLSGFICYYLESQGYVRLISEIGDAAAKELGLGSDNHEVGANGQAHQAGITETQSGR
jgi:hypothetical protein